MITDEFHSLLMSHLQIDAMPQFCRIKEERKSAWDILKGEMGEESVMFRMFSCLVIMPRTAAAVVLPWAEPNGGQTHHTEMKWQRVKRKSEVLMILTYVEFPALGPHKR